MRAITAVLLTGLTKAQTPSSSSDGDSSGWGVNEPGPGDRGYRPSRGTVRIRTGLELACPRPGDAANSALEARTNFHALYDEMFSRIDHGGKISCMDVVCSVVPVSGNVVVLVDLAIASEVGEDANDGGWFDHADRRLTAGDCWGANAHSAPGDRCYRPSCKAADPAEDNGWTTWNDRRLQGSSDSAEAGLTEVCVEADDDGEGWTDHTDRRRRLDLDTKAPLGGAMETFMWQMIEGRRLHGHTAVDAEEALAAYEVAAAEMAISGAMGDAFEEAFRGPPSDVDKEVGPGDRGYDASLVFGDCSVDNSGTLRLIRQSEASVDEEEAGGGGGGGSKKKSSSSDEIVIGVVVAVAFLIILCGVLYCAGCGRGGGGKSSRNSSSCASASAACASTPAEPVKLGPLEPEPDKSGMIRSYEMASTSSPRALEEGKEDVYATTTHNPIKTPVV